MITSAPNDAQGEDSLRSAQRAFSPATRTVKLDGPFRMYRGGELAQVQIACETWGTLNAKRDNVVLLFTGLSPSAHAASSVMDPEPGWWEGIVGHGKVIDIDRFHVVCINSLGSCFGSTGPASLNPATGRYYRLEFPELTVEDIAHAAHDALCVLGIEHVNTVVGASLGGMSALAYALYYPDTITHIVNLCSAAHATPYAIAVRSLQREMIRSDPHWMGGNYPPYREPVEGMRLARKLGLISYRSAVEWEGRFARDRSNAPEAGEAAFAPEFQIEAYLDVNARRFVGSFDANSYLYLSRAMDWFDVDEHSARLAPLEAMVRGKRALVMGVETDLLFPLYQQREIARLLSACGMEVEFHALPSIQGHDSFLVDRERFGPPMQAFFASCL